MATQEMTARTGNSGFLDSYFSITQRGSTVRQELLAGLTTFLAMVYSIIVVPNMLGAAGFEQGPVFVATCLVAGVGSIVMGLWANLPLAIGCAISLTAFTAFSLVLGQHISVPVALGAVFLMGVLFTIISATGIRSWILRNLPQGVAHGTGIGIGLFLLLIAANGVGLVIKNPLDGLPVALGDFDTFPVIMSLVGLAVIIGLEKLKVPGGILLTIIGISIVGLIFDPAVHFSGIFAMPSLSDENGNSLIGSLDIMAWFIPFLLFLGIATPPVAGIYIADFFMYRRNGYQDSVLTQEPQIKALTFVAWISGAVVGFMTVKGVFTLTTIPSVDSIVVACIAYALLSRLGQHR